MEIPTTKTLAGLSPPPLRPASFLKMVRASKGNPFETFPLAAYEQPLYLATSPDSARQGAPRQ